MGIIRFLLAFSVVFIHLGNFPLTNSAFVGGTIAVQLFFGISGFYMALVLNEKCQKELLLFYLTRVFRLFPTYWAILAFTICYQILSLPQNYISQIFASDWSFGSKLLILCSNFFIFGSDLIMFFYPSQNGLEFTASFGAVTPAFNAFHTIPQAWSLPLEMLFYAIAPFVVGSKKRLLFLILISLLCRLLVYKFFGNGDPWNYRFFPNELGFFCLGSLLYFLYKAILNFELSNLFGKILLLNSSVYIIFFKDIPILLKDTTLFPGNQLQFYCFFFIALPFIFQASKKSKIDRWIGELSYPIYLSHILVDSVYRSFSKAGYNFYYSLLCILVLSIVLSHFFQKYVEKFLSSFLHRRSEVPKSAAA